MITPFKIVAAIIGSLFQSSASTFILKNESNEISSRDLLKFNIAIFLLDIICSLFVPNNLRFVYSTITVTMVLYALIKITNRKSIIYSFGIILILTISEVIITSLMVVVGIKSTVIIENDFYNLLANIFISVFALVIVKLPFIRVMFKKIISFFERNNKSIYYFIGCLLILYFIILKNGFELLLVSNNYINLIILFGILIMFTIIMINDLKADQLKEINKQSMNYIKKYEEIITNQGKANHEFKNQLMVIKGYAKINSPKLMEYLDSIIKDTNQMKSTYLISQLNKFPEGGIKGLLYYKLSIMEEEKIKYNIYSDETIKRKAKNLTSEQMKNITKVLGVLIDNAIDECKNQKEKIIDISLTGERGKMIFIISNPINNKKVVNKIGTGFTTKGKNHGYGLQLVRDIVGLNDYVDCRYKLEDDNYVVIMTIKVGSKKTYKR